jgi:hypothetical protein
VAIVNKQVVAASKDSIKEIERIAQEKTGVEHIPVILVEGGDRVFDYEREFAYVEEQ